MSLTKTPEITPEKLAANQANGRRSRGPVTPEGLERRRQAHIRHGFYSREGDEALRILGEDPEEFRALFRSLVVTWQPADEFEEGLVVRLARALWRMDRADRQQEAMVITQIKNLDKEVDRMAREELLAYERKRAGLDSLLEAAGEAGFVTRQIEIDALAAVCGGKLEARTGEILLLLHRLAKDNLDTLGLPAPEGLALRPAPGLAEAEGPARDQVRERLLALLREEGEALEEHCAAREAELVETTSPHYRDAMTTPHRPQATLMARMEDANLRQVKYLTGLLMQLQDRRIARVEADRQKIEDLLERQRIEMGGPLAPQGRGQPAGPDARKAVKPTLEVAENMQNEG